MRTSPRDTTPDPEHRPLPSVSAVVPAHNEHDRIRGVLTALIACPFLTEVVVVDDGSNPPLAPLLWDIQRVHIIRHENNKGKGAAMEAGVQATTGEFIFFCDADLVGLKSEHVATMVLPVLSHVCHMFIGIRNNLSQRLIRFIALNSGERCLSRSDWNRVPHFYKKRFRIETGINVYMWTHDKRIMYQRFPYRQTIRERKYGFWIGTRGRIRMIIDIVSAWIYASTTHERYRASTARDTSSESMC